MARIPIRLIWQSLHALIHLHPYATRVFSSVEYHEATIGRNAREDMHQPHAGCIGLNLQQIAKPGTTSQPISSLVVIIELTLPRHASQRGATAGLWRYPDAELLRLVPHSHHEGHR